MTDRLGLIAATLQMARAEIAHDRAELSKLLNALVPSGWPPPLNDDNSMNYFARALQEHPNAGGWVLWYFILRCSGRGERVVIGNGGFKGRPDERGTVEVGYSVMEEHQGAGYATEAVKALIAWAFSHPEVSRVIAETYPELGKSIRVLKKNGFVEAGPGSEEGVIRFELTRAMHDTFGGLT